MNSLITAVSVILLSVMALSWAGSGNTFDKVINGEATLQCHFRDGIRPIPVDKIVSYDSDNNYWKFTNGGSKSCEVISHE